MLHSPQPPGPKGPAPVSQGGGCLPLSKAERFLGVTVWCILTRWLFGTCEHRIKNRSKSPLLLEGPGKPHCPEPD